MSTHHETTEICGLPIGAEISAKGVHFRVWAPEVKEISVCVYEDTSCTSILDEFPLRAEDHGYFSAIEQRLSAGALYRYRIGADELPDPASRFQPCGPLGPSQVIDPALYVWSDLGWKGFCGSERIIYEMHIGAFTPEGTWKAAQAQLPELAALGVTTLEIMPVADFTGDRGWGYDGVNLFSPTRLYGTPDEFREFVNEAHVLGLEVILDVVYNHLGPEGNYIGRFSAAYFSRTHKCEWGEAINFDGPSSGPVREYFSANAAYWISEFHLDGLRLDATQQIFDDSPGEHIVSVIAQTVRRAAPDRATFIVAENESQDVRLLRPRDKNGFALDAVWNDDFHHSALVALTGRAEAYYTDYKGEPQEFISMAKWGFLYQGQYYKWQKKRRGTPSLDLPAAKFVTFIQNHDQIANSFQGRRIHALTSPGRLRAMTALLLLGPGTPMLFQGQEFAATTPFLFFADHPAELAKLVRQGRRDFLSQFPTISAPETASQLRNPQDLDTFSGCKLDFADRAKNATVYRLHKDLIRLRKETLAGRLEKGMYDGAVLGAESLALRFFGSAGDDFLLLVNLGRDLHLDPCPEPLLAPPQEHEWQTLWSSEDPRYGGQGTPALDSEPNWLIPGQSAVLLSPKRISS